MSIPARMKERVYACMKNYSRGLECIKKQGIIRARANDT